MQLAEIRPPSAAVSFVVGQLVARRSRLALVSAARLAKERGEEKLAERWLHRAGELHSATMHYMSHEEFGFADYEEEGPAAGRAWLAWPTHFLPYDDERLRETTQAVLDRNLAKVRGLEGNGLYPTKVAIGAAIAFSDEEQREKALEIAERLASEIANQETYTIGETFAPVDDDGDGKTDRFLNAVSTPHLWSSILVYVTAVAYHHPEKFDRYREVLPEVTVPDVRAPGVPGDGSEAGGVGADDVGVASDAASDGGSSEAGGGCNCRAREGRAPSPTLPIVVLVLLVGGLRSRRSNGDGCQR